MKLVWLAIVCSSLMAGDAFSDYGFGGVADGDSVSSLKEKPSLFESPYLNLFSNPTSGRKLLHNKRTRKLKRKEQKLKNEIDELTKELKQKRKTFKNIGKRSQKNRNLHTAVIRESLMNEILGKKKNKESSRKLLRLLTDPKAANVLKINKKDSKKSASRKLINVMARTLTLADCKKIAERKLSYEKYRELQSEFKQNGYSELKKKTRMLEETEDEEGGGGSGIIGTVNEFFDSVYDSLGEFLNGSMGSTVGAAAAGAFAALKLKRDRKFRRLKTGITRKTDLARILVQVLKHQSDAMANLDNRLNLSITKVMVIDKNMGERFERKYNDFTTMAKF